MTDPFITGWMDSGNADRGEIGDKCTWQGLFDLVLATGKFAMQPLWSNRAGNCVRHTTVGVPGAPIASTATVGDQQATVAFRAPASDGGAPITAYTVVAHDSTNATRGGQTASDSQGPITISGLTDGDTYSFTVAATNINGIGSASGTSNQVIPAIGLYAPGTPTYRFGILPSVTGSDTQTVSAQLHWTASPSTGVTYELQEEIDGGAWATVYSGARQQFETPLAFNTTYEFRVRSTLPDSSSDWTADTPFTVLSYQDAVIKYSGPWTKLRNTQLWGGTDRFTKAANATASLSISGRTFAIIGRASTGNGSAKLYVDGDYKATLNEHASKTTFRDIISGWGSPRTGSHTIRIVNLATSGHPRFDIDGIVVFR